MCNCACRRILKFLIPLGESLGDVVEYSASFFKVKREVKLNNILSRAATVLLGGALLGCGLTSDVTIEAFNLQVVPSPAQEGDLVSFNLTLTVIANGDVTLTASIDDQVHATTAAPRLFSGVYTWEIGDAGDLIDEYGLGDHTARIRVHDPASDRTATSELVTFTLVEAVP